MQRRAPLASALPLVALAALATLGACGQITRLSDDYTFTDDAGAGATPSDAAADRVTATDSAVEGGGGDGGPKCSAQQQSDTAKVLENAGATTSFPPTVCQTCLQAQCCTEIVDCSKASGGSNCKDQLSCVIKCQEKGVGERAACVNACNAVSLVNALVSCSNACPGNPCKLR